jgi:exopolysaccharide production protein ExoQ
MRLLRRLERPTPALLGIIVAVLALSPELKMRVRDATASFGGSVDLQILVELAVWIAIGAWVGVIVAKGLASRTYSFATLGGPLRVLLVVVCVVVLAAAVSFSIRSVIRSVQFVVLGMTMLLVSWESRRDNEFIPSMWIWLRRCFVATIVLSMVISAVLPIWEPHIDVDGFPRYRWFAAHPIQVGGMTGVALLMLMGSKLGLPDRTLGRVWRLLAIISVPALAVALVATRARGGLVAFVAGSLVLLALARRGPAKRIGTMALGVVVLGMTMALVTPAGQAVAERVLTRGQTAEQITSLSQRTELMAIAGDLIAERPIFGHGYIMAGPMFTTYFPWAGHGHNILVEIAVDMGVVGVLAFVTLLLVSVAAFVRAWRSRRAPLLRGVAPEIAAVFALILLMGVISPGIGGGVGYEAAGFLLFVIFADIYRGSTRGETARLGAGLIPSSTPR